MKVSKKRFRRNRYRPDLAVFVRLPEQFERGGEIMEASVNQREIEFGYEVFARIVLELPEELLSLSDGSHARTSPALRRNQLAQECSSGKQRSCFDAGLSCSFAPAEHG